MSGRSRRRLVEPAGSFVSPVDRHGGGLLHRGAGGGFGEARQAGDFQHGPGQSVHQRRDNVFVERLWRSVKYEKVYLRAYESVDDALSTPDILLEWHSYEVGSIVEVLRMDKSVNEMRRAEHLAHVRTVLRAVDPNGGLLEVGETLAKVIQSDSKAAEAFTTIQQHISIKSFDENAQRIYDSYLVLYNRALRVEGKVDPEPFGGPDGTSDLLSVSYLHAQNLLRTPEASEKLTFEGLRTRLPEAAAHVTTAIDGEFLAHLLLETKTRANRDASFAREIQKGKESLVAALPQLEQVAPQQQQGGGGGACERWLGIPTSSRACWVAGLIAVVIIIAAK